MDDHIHFIEKCRRHGNVIRQCRCVSTKKTVYLDGCTSQCEANGIETLEQKIAALTARAERAEAMVVWAVTHSAEYYADKPIGTISYFVTEARAGSDIVDCDGTAPSILAAVEKAMGKA